MADKSFGVKDINLIGASGTPEIESPNNLNINAVNVAISTDMSVGGALTVTGDLTVNGTTTTIDTAVTAVDSLAVDGAIASGGTATFGGSLNVGSTSTQYTHIKVNRSDSGYIFEGGQTGSFTSRIFANGSATFAGSNVDIDSTGQITIKKTASFTDPSFRILDRNNSNANGVLMYGNGNITAAGRVFSNQWFQSDRTDGTNSAFYATVSGTEKLNIRANGSASFAAGAFAIESDGDISTNVRCHGHIELDSTGGFSSPKIKLFSNTGAATFANTITAGTETGTGTNVYASGSIQGIVSGTQKWYIAPTGAATFAGRVTCNGGTTSTNALQISGNNNSAKGIEVYNAGGSLNASINLAGTIISAGDAGGGSADGSRIDGGSGFSASFNNSSSFIYRGYQTGSSSSTFSVTASGNLTVSGQVTAAGGFSDIRFKENITDANPQLADAVALGSQLKNWDWKDNAPLNEELRAKRFLGLVAQEAEKVCPGLTYTIPRTKQGAEITPETTDAEGNVIPATYEELDDSYKAINHDILVMKLLGAVAEQNTRIETLEAKVAALEG